jgi:hypothetical protein
MAATRQALEAAAQGSSQQQEQREQLAELRQKLADAAAQHAQQLQELQEQLATAAAQHAQQLAAAAAQHAQQLDELHERLQQAEAARQALQHQLEAEQDTFKLQLDSAAESMQQSVDSSRQLYSQLEESQAEVACLQGHLEQQEQQLQVGRACGLAGWLAGWLACWPAGRRKGPARMYWLGSSIPDSLAAPRNPCRSSRHSWRRRRESRGCCSSAAARRMPWTRRWRPWSGCWRPCRLRPPSCARRTAASRRCPRWALCPCCSPAALQPALPLYQGRAAGTELLALKQPPLHPCSPRTTASASCAAP